LSAVDPITFHIGVLPPIASGENGLDDDVRRASILALPSVFDDALRATNWRAYRDSNAELLNSSCFLPLIIGP
jgi:hypothetical protein